MNLEPFNWSVVEYITCHCSNKWVVCSYASWIRLKSVICCFPTCITYLLHQQAVYHISLNLVWFLVQLSVLAFVIVQINICFADDFYLPSVLLVTWVNNLVTIEIAKFITLKKTVFFSVKVLRLSFVRKCVYVDISGYLLSPSSNYKPSNV